MKTPLTPDKATARPFAIHYQKLSTSEPFVVIQQNRDEYTNQVWLVEIPVSNIQDRSSVAVRIAGDWFPLANQRDIEHAALIAVAEAAKALVLAWADSPLELGRRDDKYKAMKAATQALANLAAVRGQKG